MSKYSFFLHKKKILSSVWKIIENVKYERNLFFLNLHHIRFQSVLFLSTLIIESYSTTNIFMKIHKNIIFCMFYLVVLHTIQICTKILFDKIQYSYRIPKR